MKKFLFVCLICLSSALGYTKAADVSYLMFVQTKNGTIEYELSESPRVSFSSTLMDVYVGGVFFHSFERSDVKDIHFGVKGGSGQGGDPEDPIVTEVEEMPITRFQYVDNATVRIEGSEVNGVSVYDIAGRLQPASIRYEGNAVVIRLAALPSGIYVIKTSQTTYKIVKR